MADSVTVKQIHDGVRYTTYHITNESDGTGESAVKKIDLTNLSGDNGTLEGGNRVNSLSLVDISGEVWGFNYVVLAWDRDPTNEVIAVLQGDVSMSFASIGGKHDPKRGQSGTGDILVSTDGGADGSGYNLVMRFRKKY